MKTTILEQVGDWLLASADTPSIGLQHESY